MKKSKPVFEVTMRSPKAGEYFNSRLTRRDVSSRLYSAADVRLVQNLIDSIDKSTTVASITVADDTYSVRLVA
jgi:hypothetical protein